MSPHIFPGSSLLCILAAFLHRSVRGKAKGLFANYGTVKKVSPSCSWQEGFEVVGWGGKKKRQKWQIMRALWEFLLFLLTAYLQSWSWLLDALQGQSFVSKEPYPRNTALRCWERFCREESKHMEIQHLNKLCIKMCMYRHCCHTVC